MLFAGLGVGRTRLGEVYGEHGVARKPAGQQLAPDKAADADQDVMRGLGAGAQATAIQQA
ncbi:hypothetical protein D3C78_1981260 [compost metagenome]